VQPQGPAQRYPSRRSNIRTDDDTTAHLVAEEDIPRALSAPYKDCAQTGPCACGASRPPGDRRWRTKRSSKSAGIDGKRARVTEARDYRFSPVAQRSLFLRHEGSAEQSAVHRRPILRRKGRVHSFGWYQPALVPKQMGLASHHDGASGGHGSGGRGAHLAICFFPTGEGRHAASPRVAAGGRCPFRLPSLRTPPSTPVNPITPRRGRKQRGRTRKHSGRNISYDPAGQVSRSCPWPGTQRRTVMDGLSFLFTNGRLTQDKSAS